MKSKAIAGIVLAVLLAGVLGLAFNVQQVESLGSPATEWSRTYGGTGTDEGRSVVQTTDGGYAIAGRTYSFGEGSGDFWLVKVNSTGHEQWNRSYGGLMHEREEAYSIVQTSDGGYALAGLTTSYGHGGSGGWLVKVDSTGQKQWNRTLGGVDGDVARSVVETSDGAYVFAGYTNSWGAGGSDFWLARVEGPAEPGDFPCPLALLFSSSDPSPEIQFLRGFRDQNVLSTFAGEQFMRVFDAWYYSFSPAVAKAIAGRPALKGFLKAILYPLIGTLHLSSLTYQAFAFSPEFGVVMAGLVTSSLIGVIYFSPMVMAALAILRRLGKSKIGINQVRLIAVPWVLSMALILLGELLASPVLMMFATGAFVLLTLTLSALVVAIKVMEFLT